jgi:ABC-type nitrate/sulfonate/bicarbonate transport system substrate-binding protein
MLSSSKNICAVIVTFAVTTSAFASDPNLVRTMNVSLAFNGEPGHAVIWVADGTHFSDLAVVADAATKVGMTKITLSVEARGSEPVPTHVSGDQHVGIRLYSDHVELFVNSGVPYEFIKTLSTNLRQLPNVSEVKLRSTSIKHVETKGTTGNDPFGGSARTSAAPSVKQKQSADPFGS